MSEGFFDKHSLSTNFIYKVTISGVRIIEENLILSLKNSYICPRLVSNDFYGRSMYTEEDIIRYENKITTDLKNITDRFMETQKLEVNEFMKLFEFIS
jgi:hypothetical protein